jgi:hypothetical protein
MQKQHKKIAKSRQIRPLSSSMEIMRAAAMGFESGFSGFHGLTITSPV